MSISEHLTAANPALAAREQKMVPGMANWAGEGPGGQSCFGCALFRQIKKPVGQDKDVPREGRCRKYININRALYGSSPILYIPPDTPCCRHFELKEVKQ